MNRWGIRFVLCAALALVAGAGCATVDHVEVAAPEAGSAIEGQADTQAESGTAPERRPPSLEELDASFELSANSKRSPGERVVVTWGYLPASAPSPLDGVANTPFSKVRYVIVPNETLTFTGKLKSPGAADEDSKPKDPAKTASVQ